MTPPAPPTQDAWRSLLPAALRIIGSVRDSYGVLDVRMGSGTVPMFRFGHRVGKDIDLFAHDAQALAYLPQGDIDFIVAGSVTQRRPTEMLEFEGRTIPRTPLWKWVRGDNCRVQDRQWCPVENVENTTTTIRAPMQSKTTGTVSNAFASPARPVAFSHLPPTSAAVGMQTSGSHISKSDTSIEPSSNPDSRRNNNTTNTATSIPNSVRKRLMAQHGLAHDGPQPPRSSRREGVRLTGYTGITDNHRKERHDEAAEQDGRKRKQRRCRPGPPFGV